METERVLVVWCVTCDTPANVDEINSQPYFSHHHQGFVFCNPDNRHDGHEYELRSVYLPAISDVHNASAVQNDVYDPPAHNTRKPDMDGKYPQGDM